jgi:hypothetical protein
MLVGRACDGFDGEGKMEKFRQLAVWCVVIPLLAAHASAREGVTVTRDRCYISIGPYMMNYTAYQPEARSNGPFCVDLPATGRSLIVLDVEQQSGGMGLSSDYYNELRDMAIDFRLVRNVGQRADDEVSEPDTEAYLPPRKYPAGTLRFEHNFAQAGRFIAVVSARDDHGRFFVSRFPLTVGPRFDPMPYSIGTLVLAAAAGCFLAYRMAASRRVGRIPRIRKGRGS